jgi:hypothetical protein
VRHTQDNGNRVEMVPVISRTKVNEIVSRFASLNPYDRRFVDDSILKIEKVNDGPNGKPRALRGFAISAKRYALYERTGDDVRIIDPKAHGLGYLYPPQETREEGGPPHTWAQPPWTLQAWEWILRQELDLKRVAPKWLHLPAMMRVVLSTPFVLERLNRRTRPYNFLFCPLIDLTVGYPQGVDRHRCTLIAAFTKDRDAWLTLPCIDVSDGTKYELSFQHDTRRNKVIPQTYGYVLHFYPCREESKSLAPDGSACTARTRGLLKRATVVGGQQHYVGKETDRRWEFGDDLSVLRSKAMEFRRRTSVADRTLREQMQTAGMRALMRATGLSQHTLEAIRHGKRVRGASLDRVRAILG